MPKPPKFIHPIRALRAALGPVYTQARFAALVGVSTSAIQRIELGKLGVSEELALRISAATGADPDSLRTKRGKPRDLSGNEFTRGAFDEMRNSPMNSADFTPLQTSLFLEKLRTALEAANRERRFFQFTCAFGLWLDKAIADFGLRSAYEKILYAPKGRLERMLIEANPPDGA